jgi:hypothetical protein
MMNKDTGETEGYHPFYFAGSGHFPTQASTSTIQPIFLKR